MYRTNRQLDIQQWQDVKQLYRIGREADNGSPVLYSDRLLTKRSPKSNWLYYEEERCYGSASVFYFYDNACEVSLLVDPMRRQLGIATELLRRLYPQFVNHHMQNIIFSLGADSPQRQWLRSKGLIYSTSEYYMRRQGFEPQLTADRRIRIRKAEKKDLDTLCQIDKQCFNHRAEMLERYRNLLEDQSYSLLVAELKGVVIGKAHINWQNNEAVLSDIAILPLHQKQGFGGELLAGIIEKSLKEGCSVQTLSVETSNTHALNLYQRYGFQTVEAYDYWEWSIMALERYLKKK